MTNASTTGQTENLANLLDEELTQLAQNQFETPEFERFYSVPLTLERARFFSIQLVLYGVNQEQAFYLTLINDAIKGEARARAELLKEIQKRCKSDGTSDELVENQQDIVRIYLPYNGRLTPEEEERWHKEGKFELRPEEYWISHDGDRIEAVRRPNNKDE